MIEIKQLLSLIVPVLTAFVVCNLYPLPRCPIGIALLQADMIAAPDALALGPI